MTWFVQRKHMMDRDVAPVFVTSGSVRETLTTIYPGFVEFGSPTIVLVDRVPVLRADWDSPIQAHVCVEAIAVQNGAETLAIISIAITVASLITTGFLIAMMPSAVAVANSGELPAAAPVFTFAGQENQKRLNQVIEKAYGKNRWWPTYLSAPYVEYIENRPTIRMLLSLGFGDFEVHDVRVNDTSFDAIAGASWEYLPAGTTLDASKPYDVVAYAKDFANTEIRGPNEDDYAVVGPFAITSAGTDAEVVNVNICFPAGLYDLSGTTLVSRTVTYSASVTPIDGNGTSIGSTTTTTFSHTAASTTPQRFTDTIQLPSSGRYSISIARTSAKNTSTSGQDRLQVESVCGMRRSFKTYAVSSLNIELLGSDVITADSAQKVNLVATSKLPVYDGASWNLQTTRNPVWVFLDIFRATYGAGLPDSSFDMVYYRQLAKDWSTAYFDQCINNKTTVWEMATTVARTMRGEPYIAGSDIRIALDSPTQVPVAMFNQDNAADLKWSVNFKQPLECDCVEVAFVDPITGLQDTVMFTPAGSAGVNPKKIAVDGLQDRDLAWQYGAYYYYSIILQREAVSFTTGAEGFVPLFGDLVAVSWGFPAWGEAGAVVAYDSATRVMTMSEPCVVTSTAKWLALRTERGETYGPVVVSQGVDSYHLVLGAALTRYFDFSAEAAMPVLFTFGDTSVITRTFKVTKTSPSNGQFKIEAVKRDPAIFSYDGLAAPARGQDLLPYPATSGAIPWVKGFDENAQFLRIQWGIPINGAVVDVAYYSTLSATTEQIASPWTAGFTMVTVSDLFGTTAYIPRTKGYLFIRVRTSTALADTYWWRAYIGDFESMPPNGYPVAMMLVNNCDANYVAPLDPANAGSQYPQATCLVDGASQWDVGLKALTFVCDSPDIPITLTLMAFAGTKVASATAYLPQGGKYTFTREQLLANGFDKVGTSTTYPTIQCTASSAGTGPLTEMVVTPMALTNGPASQVSATYLGAANPDRSGVYAWADYASQSNQPIVWKGVYRNFALAYSGAAGYERMIWGVNLWEATLPTSGITTKTIAAPYLRADLVDASTQLNVSGVMVCNYGFYTAGISQTETKPCLFIAIDATTLKEVVPGITFLISTPWANATVDLLMVQSYLKANTEAAPNTFTAAAAYAYRDLLMPLAALQNLRFVAIEFAFPSGTIIGQASACPVDILGRNGNASAFLNLQVP